MTVAHLLGCDVVQSWRESGFAGCLEVLRPATKLENLKRQ